MSGTAGMPPFPGSEAVTTSLAAATKSFQGLAEEAQKMSKDAVEHTTQTMEKLRGAKTFEDVVSIQTSYLQQSFANYADYTRRFSEMMMSLPMEFAKQSRSAFQESTEAVKKATEQATEQFNQHRG